MGIKYQLVKVGLFNVVFVIVKEGGAAHKV